MEQEVAMKIVSYYFYLIYVCMYMINYVLKKEKETNMSEIPGYKKQKILELKHFIIFVSEILNQLFLLKKFTWKKEHGGQ